MQRRRFVSPVALGLIVTLWSFVAGAAEVASDDAAGFVKKLGDDAVAILTAPNSTEIDRKQRYRNLLEEGFAVRTIARIVIGRYWRVTTPEQRTEYLALYRDFVLESYTTRLDGVTGQTFEILGTRPSGELDTIVNTQIRTRGRAPIRVEYRVRKNRDEQKIIDVVIEGVSLIRTQRSEFKSIIIRDGIEGLLDVLRRRSTAATHAN